MIQNDEKLSKLTNYHVAKVNRQTVGVTYNRNGVLMYDNWYKSVKNNIASAVQSYCFRTGDIIREPYRTLVNLG